MKYRSSRGCSGGSTFEQALFSGYAEDGGILVPENVPTLDAKLLQKWKEVPPTYQQVIYEIVSLFVSEEELPRDVLQRCIVEAHKEFDIDTVIGYHDCVGGETSSREYTVVEMFHGKTKSFKDYSLSIVGRLMEYFVQKRKANCIVLVGTSGDTGSAAIEAVKGLHGIDIIVLYPLGKISEVQELQMITVAEDNVHVFATEGNNDDLDRPIKQAFPAPGLVCINSINWGRVMIQIAHHVFLCTRHLGEPVDIYVPTGGAGNLVSGLVGCVLGFPVNFYCAQNVNDSVEKFVNTGRLVIGGEIEETYSNAMDIRNPYNVERLLYFLSGQNCELVKEIITKAEDSSGSGADIPMEIQEKLKVMVKGAMRVDTPATLKTIAECWKINKYLICPHTATAVTFVLSDDEITRTGNKAYVIATASPEKFQEAAVAAKIPQENMINQVVGKQSLLELLRERKRKEPKVMKKGQDWFEILQAEINRIRLIRKGSLI